MVGRTLIHLYIYSVLHILTIVFPDTRNVKYTELLVAVEFQLTGTVISQLQKCSNHDFYNFPVIFTEHKNDLRKLGPYLPF